MTSDVKGNVNSLTKHPLSSASHDSTHGFYSFPTLHYHARQQSALPFAVTRQHPPSMWAWAQRFKGPGRNWSVLNFNATPYATRKTLAVCFRSSKPQLFAWNSAAGFHQARSEQYHMFGQQILLPSRYETHTCRDNTSSDEH